MDRNARLEYCQKCTKREYSPKKGIVCSLTKEHATFNGTCVDFNEDKKEAQVVEQQKTLKQNEQIQEDSLGLSQIGIKDGVVAGIIVIAGAIIWFALGLIYLDRIFFYPPILLAIGIYALIKGINKRKKNRLAENEILDMEV